MAEIFDSEKMAALVKKWEATGLLQNKKTFIHKYMLVLKLELEAIKFLFGKEGGQIKDPEYFDKVIIQMREEGWFLPSDQE